jgi:hypothetical protein
VLYLNVGQLIQRERKMLKEIMILMSVNKSDCYNHVDDDCIPVKNCENDKKNLYLEDVNISG